MTDHAREKELLSSDPSPSVEEIRKRLRQLGEDLNRGAAIPNLAEQIFDQCDLLRACDAKDAELARLRAAISDTPDQYAQFYELLAQAHREDCETLDACEYGGDGPTLREIIASCRQRAEQAESALSALRLRISYLEGTAMPHARKQENANGFQKGWHAALSRAGEHAESIEYLRSIVPEPAIDADHTPLLVAPSGADEPEPRP